MSLPFLQDTKKMAAGILERRKKDGSVTHEEPAHSPEHLSAAETLLHAIKNSSPEQVVTALKNLFSMLDSEPHEGEE